MRRLASTSTLFTLGLVACDPAVDDSTSTEASREITYRTIDHALVDALGPEDTLVVDVTIPDVAWVFELERGPIDFDRITVVCPNGEHMPLQSWFELAGKAPAPDSKGSFVLANDPADFGTLSPEDVDMMWELTDAPQFRAPAGNIIEIDVDGRDYLVCTTDDMFSCNNGGTWIAF